MKMYEEWLLMGRVGGAMCCRGEVGIIIVGWSCKFEEVC